MEQILDRINKLNVAAKAGIFAGVVILLTTACYFLLIQDVETQIESLVGQQSSLDKTYAEKKEIADNLNDRRREMDQLDQKLQDALTELPEKKDIEELLGNLNDIGRKSGLDIMSVVPAGEAPEAFYSRVPVMMTVNGNYHEIALFLQEISNMRRIVNITNIKLDSPSRRGDKLMLKSDFTATAFRFNGPK
ncbi:MAG: type 4a pilus biogenesis protein PilO [Archangium sp.]|nr:type 4a pilus biogenesis protein PilO [Archangium sp.]